MNPKPPRLGGRRVIAALKRDGWYEHHQRGSHLAMRHPEKQGQVTIPIHSGRDIHPTTLKFILRQADLTESDFLKLLKRSESMEYTIILQPWDDGRGYTVTVPSLPGCITQGSTKDEALANAKEAIMGHIEGLRKAGEAVPIEEDKPELAQVAI